MQHIPRQSGAKIYQFRLRGRTTVNKEPEEKAGRNAKKTTSITIPKHLHRAVELDAIRCHRSWLGQLIAVLDAVYTGADVGLHGIENYQSKASTDNYQHESKRKVA